MTVVPETNLLLPGTSCLYSRLIIVASDHSKTSRNRLTMGLALDGPFRDVASLASYKISTMALDGTQIK